MGEWRCSREPVDREVGSAGGVVRDRARGARSTSTPRTRCAKRSPRCSPRAARPDRAQHAACHLHRLGRHQRHGRRLPDRRGQRRQACRHPAEPVRAPAALGDRPARSLRRSRAVLRRIATPRSPTAPERAPGFPAASPGLPAAPRAQVQLAPSERSCQPRQPSRSSSLSVTARSVVTVAYPAPDRQVGAGLRDLARLLQGGADEAVPASATVICTCPKLASAPRRTPRSRCRAAGPGR